MSVTNLSVHLSFLYGADRATQVLGRVEDLISKYRGRIQAGAGGLTEQDSILITYGDQIQSPDEKPLRTLSAFCEKYLAGVVGGIHFLPFYPWSSDDGFAVVDYRNVDPDLGGWKDIDSLPGHFRLMFDAVLNHVSSQSEWFKGFLRDEPAYRDYFIVVEGTPDLSRVVRPRALPLLTSFQTPSGEKRVWTTFSGDQIDLNYKNPEVLLEALDILFSYVEHGATFIRLDAIAYLWKEIGTACIHLPQTHRVIQLLRTALDEAAPHVRLITETNVPQADNLSYFGDGTNEAQLVYNFALPVLILHTFRIGHAGLLSNWAGTLALPLSSRTTYFNFLASHDGIGLNPAQGILSSADIKALVDKTLEHGGLISYKQEADGSQSPYELNINYFDALSNPNGDESLDVQVSRFMSAQAIMLSLAGVPGIYFHSLFGSRGWMDGVKQTGRNRTINRQKCRLDQLQGDLEDGNSLRAKVFGRYRQLLTARRRSPAFHPHGDQKVQDIHPSVFAIERISPDETSHTLCLHNVGGRQIAFGTNYTSGMDLLTGEPVQLQEVFLEPYQVLWVNL